MNTEELNYLVWRYLQETGLELAAFALRDEASVAAFDEKYGEFVPIGGLVSLVQKGVLYSETEQLVRADGRVQDELYYRERLGVLRALSADGKVNPRIEPSGRFEPAGGAVGGRMDVDGGAGGTGGAAGGAGGAGAPAAAARDASPEFIQVLDTKLAFEPALCSSWSPAGAATFAYGLAGACARIRNLADGAQVVLKHPVPLAAGDTAGLGPGPASSDITAVSWSPTGSLLVTCVESGEIRLWNADGRLKNVLYLHHSPIITIKWSANGLSLITLDADNAAIVWDVASGSVLQHIDLSKSPDQPVPAGPAVAHASKPDDLSLGIDVEWIDDAKFLIPGLNGNILVFRLGDRPPIGALNGHSKAISAIKFNTANSQLLTASDDKTLRIWKGNSFNSSHVLVGHSQPITFAAWLSTEFVVSCSLDSSIRIWDTSLAKDVFDLVLDGVPILNGALSPDGSKLAVATTESIISVYKVELAHDIKLKDIAQFQPQVAQEDSTNFVTSLEWNCASDKLVCTYSKIESVVVAL